MRKLGKGTKYYHYTIATCKYINWSDIDNKHNQQFEQISKHKIVTSSSDMSVECPHKRKRETQLKREQPVKSTTRE